MSDFRSRGKEWHINAVMKVMLEQLVAEADRDFMQRLINARQRATDRVGSMRLDVNFADKVFSLRETGVITTPVEVLREKAANIVEHNLSGEWFGLATQYAASLNKK